MPDLEVSPVERRSLSDSVFEQLRTRIVDGGFEPGATLPAERRLCEMLGVNRGALREALKRLQQAGLVEVQHGGHTRVVDFHEHAGLDLLPSLLVSASGTVNTQVARGIVEMRAVIAEDATRLAAKRATPEIHAAIGAILGEMERAGDDLGKRQRLAIEFWRQVIVGSQNLAYRLAYNSLRRTYDQIASVLTQVLAPEFTNLGGYCAIDDALRARDADRAARATRDLLGYGSTQLVDLLDGLDGAPSAP